MKKTIEFFMPVMRPDSARKVMDALQKQTQLITKLIIVDNSGEFSIAAPNPYSFKVLIIRPLQNIGVNAVWNYMFDSEADFVGLIGDDFELESNVIEILSKTLTVIPNAGAVTATIFRNKPIEPQSPFAILKYGEVVGRAHFGVSLFKKCTLNCLPKIPKELFMFYGDHWFGYWLKKIGYPLLEVNVGVSHYDKTDLKEKCNYKKVSKVEKNIWNQWKRSEIEL